MKTAIVILHEIYGVNSFIQSMKKDLQDTFLLQVYTPSFLARKEGYDYSQESIAYSSFMNEIGFEAATHQVESFLKSLEEEYDQFLLWGYSIGATVGWRVSHQNSKIKGLVGFYGSRIRDYLNEIPTCSTLLIYPEQEKSFDVLQMKKQLANEHQVVFQIVPATHGFADSFCSTYQEQEARKAKERGIVFLNHLIYEHYTN
jgi:dienelactone hydrolase